MKVHILDTIKLLLLVKFQAALVLFVFVNLVFSCPKMILRIKIEISQNGFYNGLGFYFHKYKARLTCNELLE